MIKKVFVVEAIPHGDDDREVIAVFSSEDKAMIYIDRQLEDEEFIDIFGEHDYSISQHHVDGMGKWIDN